MISTPMWAIVEPSGPMEKGTTYMVRPFIDPWNRSVRTPRISAGSRQLLVGPASDSRVGADEGAVLHAGHVARVGVGPVAVGPLGVGQLGEGAVVDQQLAQAVVLVGRPVAPLDCGRLGQCGDLVHPCDQLLVGGRWHGLGGPPRDSGGALPANRASVRPVHRISTDCSGASGPSMVGKWGAESQFRGCSRAVRPGPAGTGRRVRCHRPAARPVRGGGPATRSRWPGPSVG